MFKPKCYTSLIHFWILLSHFQKAFCICMFSIVDLEEGLNKTEKYMEPQCATVFSCSQYLLVTKLRVYFLGNKAQCNKNFGTLQMIMLQIKCKDYKLTVGIIQTVQVFLFPCWMIWHCVMITSKNGKQMYVAMSPSRNIISLLTRLKIQGVGLCVVCGTILTMARQTCTCVTPRSQAPRKTQWSRCS